MFDCTESPTVNYKTIENENLFRIVSEIGDREGCWLRDSLSVIISRWLCGDCHGNDDRSLEIGCFKVSLSYC